MKEKISSICLSYGDALFHLYQFHICNNNTNRLDEPIFHEHRFYEIHFAHSGSYTYTLNDRSITLRQNQMLIIPPDVSHASVYNFSWDYEYSVLSLSLDKQEGENGFYSFFSNALKSCALTPVSVSHSLIDRTIELKSGELYGAIKGECYLKMQGSALIYELFESLNHFQSAEALKATISGEDNRLVLLDALINDANRSLSDIAKEINYSQRHTARLIKSIYGSSLSELRKKDRSV